MAKVKVVAGDIENGAWNFADVFGACAIVKTKKGHMFKTESIDFIKDVKSVELVDEENVSKLSSIAGFGAAGALLLGPLGAIGGMLLGSSRKEVAFVAYLQSGTKFMATTDGKTWKKIMAAKF